MKKEQDSMLELRLILIKPKLHMKNKQSNLPTENLASQLDNEKKSWIAPKINKWENENIENGFGIGPDAGAQTYL